MNKEEFYLDRIKSLATTIRKLEHDKDKLIGYIAVRENKDYEDIRKEFDI